MWRGDSRTRERYDHDHSCRTILRNLFHFARPDCHALTAWLVKFDVSYTEHDLTRLEVADEAKRRIGVRVAPITVIGSNVFYRTFLDQPPRITAMLGLARGAQTTDIDADVIFLPDIYLFGKRQIKEHAHEYR